MKKAIFVGLLIYALIAAGLVSLNGRVLALLVPLLVYLAVGAILGPRSARVQVTRRMPGGHALAGSVMHIHLTATNQGPDAEEVLIADAIPEGLEVVEGCPQLLLPMAAGATAELEYAFRAARGTHPFPGAEVMVGEALDLFHVRSAGQVPQPLTVAPRAFKLRRLALRPLSTLAHTGPFPARRGGPGIEFHGVREYQPGDPLRWAEWRASARHPERFYTKEFEQERTAEIGLILDIREQVYDSADKEVLFEHAVQAAASLAEALLNEGNRVGLLLFGSTVDWTVPGYGRIQRERILQALAVAGFGGFQDRLEYLPTRLFPPHSQILLISPLVRGDQYMLSAMRAHGYPILVVSPNPVSLEPLGGDPTALLAARIAQLERSLMLRKLQAGGVQVLDWSVHQPLDQAIHTHLGRRALLYRGREVRA